MNIALLVTPFSDENLQLAAQVGATEIVSVYPGLVLADLLAIRDRVESFGMRLGVIERLVPTLRFIHNSPGRDQQIEEFKTLIRNMGAAGVPVLCYSWMPDDDWQRTSVDVLERGGAKVTALDLAQQSAVPNDTGYRAEVSEPTSADQLWENLEYFLREVVPVAERAGVKLSMHPDDPPVEELYGQARIMSTPGAFERLVGIVESPSNGICFCQGTLASSAAEYDIPALIRRLAPHINFAHFRDVVGAVPSFRESFHDNGKTDMVACMEAYYAAGIDCPIRPDHAPTMAGESNELPGYHMLGRLFAVGYMRGLMQSAERTHSVVT
jgi:mannonate dehydratase